MRGVGLEAPERGGNNNTRSKNSSSPAAQWEAGKPAIFETKRTEGVCLFGYFCSENEIIARSTQS